MTDKNTAERACFIINPRSAGGRTGRKQGEVEASVARWFDKAEVWATERPKHATELCRKAIDDGFDVVVAVGGDGTAHEVANGLFDGDVARNPDVVFTVIPAGTGSDLVKTLKMPSRIDDAVATAAIGSTRQSDAILATFATPKGEGTEICINVAGFGMSGDVVQRVNQSNKRFGGTISFVTATIASLARFEPPDVDIRYVDAEGRSGEWSGSIFNVFVANGAYCGGGMWVGKGGTMQDGNLDLTIIPDMSLPRTAMSSPRLFTGEMAATRGVVRVSVSEVEATVRPAGGSSPGVLLDLDGEQPGTLPVKLRCLPGNVKIRGRWA